VLVLEHVADLSNRHAILRSADAFGVQDVWLVAPPQTRMHGPTGGGRARAPKVSKRAHRWLTVRHFGTTGECVAALRAEGIAIWATTLREGARSLALGPVLHGGDPAGLLEALPKGRLAVVMGSEAEGISAEMAAAADEAVCLPMHGFSESLNVSVATALVLQALTMLLGDSCRGDGAAGCRGVQVSR